MSEELFNEELGSVNNLSELRVLQERFPSYDPLYVAAAAFPDEWWQRGLRDWLEERWVSFKPFADSGFHTEFRRHFIQRCWELEIGTTLLDCGYVLEAVSDKGPDICVTSVDPEGHRVWIEAIAVTPGNPDSPDRVPEPSRGVQSVPTDEMILRFTSGVLEKHRKYKKYLNEGVVKPSEPLIIAVNTGSLRHPHLNLPQSALFGVGWPTISVPINNSGGPSGPVEHGWSLRESVQKRNGAEVSTRIFLDPAFSQVSAVIFSHQDIFNCPRDPARTGAHWEIFYNPLADNQLPPDTFLFCQSYALSGEFLIRVNA